jgi:hypothetical protein
MTAPDLFPTPRYRSERLHDEWPSDPLIDWKQANGLFLALSPEDQDHCSRLATRYLSLCRRIGSPVGSPIQSIEARGWTGFLEAERRHVRKLAATKTPAWVVEGTPAWKAWKRHGENKGQRMPSPESSGPSEGMAGGFRTRPLRLPRPSARVRYGMDHKQRR